MRDEQELERRIDAALRCYGEPTGGDELEQRVLAGLGERMRAESTAKKVNWLPWSGGLAIAASILVLVLYGHLWTHRAVSDAYLGKPFAKDSEVAHVVRPKGGSPTKVGTGSSAGPGRQAMLQTTETAEALPKLDVFPTPRGLNKEEEALAFFVRQAPPSEVRQFLMTQVVTDEPITIRDLEIPPIQPLEVGGR
jgi:hypothetical protein